MYKEYVKTRSINEIIRSVFVFNDNDYKPCGNYVNSIVKIILYHR